jgi:hypothetical protein
VKHGRRFQDVNVTLEYGTDLGPYSGVPINGARMTLPDGSIKVVVPDSSHDSLDERACYLANEWYIDQWEADGKRFRI